MSAGYDDGVASTGGPPSVAFPEGVHAATTWSIPPDHGGMTSALLRRSRAFAREAGVEVQILTFDPELDVAEARGRLAARGELAPGVTLRNLWEELGELPDGRVGVLPGAPRRDRPRAADPSERSRTLVGPGGEVRETLHFRADGTLAVTDRPTSAGHRVTLYARDGRRGRRWWTGRAAYRWWLDAVLGTGPAYVVVDAKALLPMFAAYRRRQTRIVHVVHGAHLEAGVSDPFGTLTASRRPMIESFDRFDAVVLLTEAQRRDICERIGPRSHAYVVPNSTDVPDRLERRERDPSAGAVLARLDANKRVGHAVTALRRAARRTGLPLRLDVYGDGPKREPLAKQAARTAGVRLHGYVAEAADRLEQASFLLLTSRSEGHALVLVEAMARGCIPIAYDVRYGPRDLITDGVDGFLVPDGDVGALARAVERFVTMESEAVEGMRAAARATAGEYSDAAVVHRWAQVLAEISTGPPRRRRRDGRELVRSARRLTGVLRDVLPGGDGRRHAR